MLMMSSRSAAFQRLKDLRDIGLIVDDGAVYLNPGMSLKRQDLCADHHLGAPSMTPQEHRRRSGSLQAKHALRIKHAGKVYRFAQFPFRD
jgi:hypothetical protein